MRKKFVDSEFVKTCHEQNWNSLELHLVGIYLTHLISFSDTDEPMADFCKITSVSSLPLNISQTLAPDMPTSPQKLAGKSGIRRPRKAPPVTNVINPKPVTYQVDDISEFKLHPRAKGSFMFVNWGVLRHFVKSKKVSVSKTKKTFSFLN